MQGESELRKQRSIGLSGLLGQESHWAFGRLMETALEKILSLRRLKRLYGQLPRVSDDQEFLEIVLDLLKIRYHISTQDRAKIPKEGSLLVVANHPFGALEGIIIATVLRSVRPDVKIMANYFLQHITEIEHLFISVDPYAEKRSPQRNIRPLREALAWLDHGGMLVAFPAGEVSHVDLRRGGITDPAWSPHFARMIRRTETPVLPVFFQGANSALFQILGLLHPHFRTVLLPRELVNKTDKIVSIQIGDLIPYEKLAAFSEDVDLTNYLRMRTYLLKTRASTGIGTSAAPFMKKTAQRLMRPLVTGYAREELAEEVSTLSPEQCVVSNGQYTVFQATAERIPRLLQEIGRLRESTFRHAGEGTGNAVDIDWFDNYYIHLFVWHNTKQEVVGAYRMGESDRILRRYGKQGLYTYTLFKYKKQFLEEINPALELGRSFVRVEYQRTYSPLLLLWKGIGQFVVKHPQYKILFGPVSISNIYHSVSQRLIVDFLKANSYMPDYAKFVKPRRPYRHKVAAIPWSRELDGKVVRDLDEVSELISCIEPDRKGVPILLRQYLKLGGKLLGFNIDNNFSGVLDGLMMLDLSQADPKILRYYMGHKAAEEFRAYHQPVTSYFPQVS